MQVVSSVKSLDGRWRSVTISHIYLCTLKDLMWFNNGSKSRWEGLEMPQTNLRHREEEI